MIITAHIKELYRYRALVRALVVRHLASRYRGSILGYLWTLVNPLFLMIVYTVAFRYLMRSQFAEGGHYNITLFCGLLPWLWTSTAITEGTNSFVLSGHLISKSHLPPQVLAVVPVVTTWINYLLSLPILVIFMVTAGLPVSVLMFFALPVAWVIHLVFLYGTVLALGAWNVFFRDVQHVVTNALSLLFFLCPIIYPLSQVPVHYKNALLWNPCALFVAIYHELFLVGALPSVTLILRALFWSVLIGAIGIIIFERHRETIPECV